MGGAGFITQDKTRASLWNEMQHSSFSFTSVILFLYIKRKLKIKSD